MAEHEQTVTRKKLPAYVAALCVAPDADIRSVLGTIDEASNHGAPVGIALVVDEHNRLQGVITDGDVREALVKGNTLDTLAHDVMTRNPITVQTGLSTDQMLGEMSENIRRSAHIRDSLVQYLVVVDEQERVVDLVDTFQLMMRSDILNARIGVIGLGFVGLTLAVSLAEVGFTVHGIDVNTEITDQVSAGTPHFYEVGLEPLLQHHLRKDRFRVHTTLPRDVDIYIVAVGTPIGPEERPLLGSVRKAAQAIGVQLKRGDLVLLRSTVPVGTTRNEVLPILEETSGLTCGTDFHLAFAPERTVEGNALHELKSLPQVVGGYTDQCQDLAAKFFGKLAPNIVRVDALESAEMCKLINNSFRDLSFAFANEFAIICDHWNVDAVKVIRAANMGYPRNRIPLPSPGVGGFCLTKDPVIYAWAGRDKGYEPRLPIDGRTIHEEIVERVGQKIIRFFRRLGQPTRTARVFIIGFAFKGDPETSDIRHSTTLDLLPLFKEAGFDLYGYDPVVAPEDIAGQGVQPVSLEEGFSKASAVLVMNNHPSYTRFNVYDLLAKMQKPGLFFDGWHLFDRHDIEQIEGITYEGLSGAL